MSGDPRIVPGGDVEFVGSSAQADALVPEQTPVVETSSVASDLGKIVADYVFSLSMLKDKDRGKRNLFVDTGVVGLLTKTSIHPYLKWDSNMNLHTSPVPREVYLNFFLEERFDFKALFDNTDLGDCIPQGDISIEATLPNILQDFGIGKKLGIATTLREAYKLTTYGVCISDVSFLKLLFPKDLPGLAYLDHLAASKEEFKQLSAGVARSNTDNSIKYKNLLPGVSKFCDAAQLTAFTQKEKCGQIVSMLNAYNQLVNEVNPLIEQEDLNPLRTAIYYRLKQYHPELTI